MAWTTPGTATAGEVLTAAFWNEQVRDNQNYLYDTAASWNVTPSSVTAAGAGSSASINANGSITVTSCTSITINGVFSSAYDQYVVYSRLANTGNDAELRIQLASAGVAAATNYNYQRLTVSDTSVSGGRATSATVESVGRLDSTGPTLTVTTIMQPFSAAATQFFSLAHDTNTTVKLHNYCGNHTTATSYDGFVLSASTGAMTGTVWVKGIG